MYLKLVVTSLVAGSLLVAGCGQSGSTGGNGTTADTNTSGNTSAGGGGPSNLGGAGTQNNNEVKPASVSKNQTPDGKIEDLKAALKDIPAFADPFLKQAAKLKYVSVPTGKSISDEICAAIEKDISKNYTINPFKVNYETGSSNFSICSDMYGTPASQRGWKVFFLDGVSIKNQFGLEGKALLQTFSEHSFNSNETLTTILLDQNNRIIEVSSFTTMTKQKIPLDYSVATLDSNGNYYSNQYYDPSFNKPHAFTTHQKYISADGKYSFQRDLNPRRAEKGSERVLSNIYKVANVADWESHTLVISHAWFGGFYSYGGKLTRHPEAYSFLHVYSVNGQEVCADGSSSTKTSWTKYPSPTAEHGYCLNDW